jgi:hypothetical protein
MFSGIPVEARPGGRVMAWGLWLLVAAGLAAMALAWARASDTIQVSQQVDWASVGLAGATAVTVGLVASILIVRQAIALRLGRLAPALARPDTAGAAPAAGPASVATASNGVTATDGALVAGARMARYHTPTCPLTVGKAVQPASRTDHERAGLQPCGVCRP